MGKIELGGKFEENFPYSRPASYLIDIMTHMQRVADEEKYTGTTPRCSCDVGIIGRATLYEFEQGTSVVTYTPTGRRVLPDDGGKPYTEASVLETTIDIRPTVPGELIDLGAPELNGNVTCYLQGGRAGAKQAPLSDASPRDIKGIDMLRSAITNGQGEYSG